MRSHGAASEFFSRCSCAAAQLPMTDQRELDAHQASLRRADALVPSASWTPSPEDFARPLPERATPTARQIALNALRNACRTLFAQANALCEARSRPYIDDDDMNRAAELLEDALRVIGDCPAETSEWTNALVFNDDFPPPHPLFPAAYPRPPAGYEWTPPDAPSASPIAGAPPRA